jgi:predicted methyltransferase
MIRKSVRCILIFLIGVIPPSAVWAQGTPPAKGKDQNSVRPGINNPFKNPNVKTWESRFESPGREVFDKRKHIVSTLKLKKGMSVADIGAGTGLFSRLFSPRVGNSGKVYVVDISKVFVNAILVKAKRQKMTNITGIVNTPKDVRLPENSVDLAFICDTYHHFEYPKPMLKSIRKALKKNGILIIIDYRKNTRKKSRWVMSHVRANKDTVIKEISAEGFKLVKDTPILKYNYFLRFKKI